MHLYIVAVGQKMPAWVNQACEEFIRRLPRELNLNIIEVPVQKRGKNVDVNRIIRDESNRILDAVPSNSHLVVTDIRGKSISTEDLSGMLQQWMTDGHDVSIVIGGPDGVAGELLDAAQQRISLSPMTFPHPLVRIILVEQLYRAWSILNNHPYHRI